MNSADIFHIEPSRQRSGGQQQQPQNRQQRHHRLWMVLFDALVEQDLPAARGAFQQLLQFDARLNQDADLMRIGKLLDEGQIYAALHFARDYKVRHINEQVIHPHTTVAHEGHPLSMTTSGSVMHLVDVKA
jgi:hypothetical protein